MLQYIAIAISFIGVALTIYSAIKYAKVYKNEDPFALDKASKMMNISTIIVLLGAILFIIYFLTK